jgi:hypothetical protein
MKTYTISDEQLAKVKEYYDKLCDDIFLLREDKRESEAAYNRAEGLYKTLVILGIDTKGVIE